MKEKLRAALASIAWEPQIQVRKTGDFYVATVNKKGRTRRVISTNRADAVGGR